MKPILIVDNEEKFCKVIQSSLEIDAIASDYVVSGEQAKVWLQKHDTELVITDLRMDGMSGLDLLQYIKTTYPDIAVIMMTAFASQKTAIEALKEGAFDYLIKPFEMDELVLRIRRIFRQKSLQEENRNLKLQSSKPVFYKKIIGRSQSMIHIYQLIQKAADSDSTVLILGESGTGKELVAETIHANSSRQTGQFIAINCAAVPENLLESELFGYEKGAFTGANQRKMGKFEVAREGTIFLDEIGDMSMMLQAKLLRVLQNKQIFRLGSTERIQINTRIIAATHRQLEKMVDDGHFRQDLFYRLNVFPISIPPLRERKEDIPELINHFMKSHQVIGIDRDSVNLLMQYDWPGNVRELENVIERAAIMADSIITPHDIPDLTNVQQVDSYSFKIPEDGFNLDYFERYLIQQALHKAKGNKTRAAEMLGITRRRLYSMMKSLNL
ncbi:MAG: sigma-54-dependent Fis family transcriptional regulator [bacterium]|nr:MAG: sigma-54-dependent Fis family transcriptional regulator [bacterium]